MKIIFPYFYGLHQLYHSAITAMYLSKIEKDFQVICLSSTKEQTAVLERIKSFNNEFKAEIIELKPPFRYKYLNIKKKLYPSVNAVVKKSRKLLDSADVIVTTSHGSYSMFKKFKITKPKLIYQYHGMGDRKYGFDKKLSNYELILVGGKYHFRRLIEENIATSDKIKIVGYPKLDFPINNKDFFKNDNPIFLYSPHWTPKLSSYKKFAKPILDFFASHRQYNLIFAPHILLSHWKFHLGYKTNFKTYNSDNIFVDYASDYSTNGTYLAISDVYIGDVSSMVYEFILRKPRPCIFLNAHNVDWKDNVDYRFWNYGPVVENFDEFEKKLEEALENKEYLKIQKENVEKYIEITDEPSSLRAARAIANYAKGLS